MNGLARTAAAAAAFVIALTGVIGLAGSQGADATSCAGGTVNTATATSQAPIDGYTGEQLTNAALIVNAGAALGMGQQAQTIAVMVAMDESGLQILDHGDAAGPDSRGLFQQRASWGSLHDRMDPTTAATAFYRHLAAVPGWQQMTPTQAAHTVQRNENPDAYTPYWAPAQAVVAALAGGSTCTAVTGNDQQLAQGLVDDIHDGKLTIAPDMVQEVEWEAQGKTVPDCGIDTTILQVMTITVEHFAPVSVSSINRRCTGQTPGAGVDSWHYKDGGGHAVDFNQLDGHYLNGANPAQVQLLALLDPLMPQGSGAGQSECRAAAGDTVTLHNFIQFSDTCNHQHIDDGGHTGGLRGT